MKDFIIEIGENGIPEQWFNGIRYKCYKGRRYFTQHKNSMHRVVWEYYNGIIPDGYEIHHIDENPHNNRIENLELVKAGDHQKIHSSKRSKDWVSNFQKLGVEAAKEWHSTKEGKEFHSKIGKESWEKREKIVKICIECEKEYSVYSGVKSYFCHRNCKAKHYRKVLKGGDKT